MKSESPSRRLAIGVTLTLALTVLIVIAIKLVTHHPDIASAPSVSPPITRKAITLHALPAQSGSGEIIKRPLPVAVKSATHEWTQGDGTSEEVIEKIAHNPDEMMKMLKENDRIGARQLVYRNDTVSAILQRARFSGEPLHRLTLPALDGQEVEVEVDRADLSPSWQTGSITGHVVGKLNSMVTVAFEFGTEAFTVLSPDDKLYLQADPREPGEIIVKSIDPATYAPGQCGNTDVVAGK